MKRDKKLFLLRAVIAAALLFAIFKFIPYPELRDIYVHSQKIYILFGFVLFVSTFYLGILRWRLLLRSLGVGVPLGEITCAYLCGFFFNLFFPSFVAGDVFRGTCVTHGGRGGEKVAASVFMDRFSGIAGLGVVAFLAYIGGMHLISRPEVLLSVLVLCFTVGGLWLAVFSSRCFKIALMVFPAAFGIKEKIQRLHGALMLYKDHLGSIVAALGVSFLIHILTAMTFYVMAKGFGVYLSPLYFLITVPVIMVVAFVPITIAGAGTRDAAMIYFFSLIGITQAVSFALSLLHLFFFVVVGIIGGILYVGIYHRWLQRRA